MLQVPYHQCHRIRVGSFLATVENEGFRRDGGLGHVPVVIIGVEPEAAVKAFNPLMGS